MPKDSKVIFESAKIEDSSSSEANDENRRLPTRNGGILVRLDGSLRGVWIDFNKEGWEAVNEKRPWEEARKDTVHLADCRVEVVRAIAPILGSPIFPKRK